ncbi:plasmid mobilization protein [Mucilaginibacter agri]|uniref:Plasmid mobilization relaxosome protein MobC n=1 Tax=Mucilaginibacter agri TaxID=2695265 RepID=A0A965ZE07_9SPHI|nr:plasmid mobilization relaxosome protein MobC [Mucilaginibacter agri]NCD68279.1 plasmid mobilization relaxosome protein MobC [Mucilaginibacter agri]
MDKLKNKGGRPPKQSGKRTEQIKVRITEDEDKALRGLEKEFGISRSDLVRKRVLYDAELILVNARELILQIDKVGVELARSGNNINQLARHANTIAMTGDPPTSVLTRYNFLMDQHINVQKELEVCLRKIIRMMHR